MTTSASPPGDARRACLTGLVDDAGLFPPAELSMPAAVDCHRWARDGAHGWMLGRFLCPSSRLDELASRLRADEGLAVGAVLDLRDDLAWDEAVGAAVADAAAADPRITVEVLEVRLPAGMPEPSVRRRQVDAVVTAAAPLMRDAGVAAFVEVPRTPAWSRDVVVTAEAVAAAGPTAGVRVGAKVRCGGPNPEAVPAPAEVAEFVAACAAAGVVCKATAGLHHPVRSRDPGTGLVTHGFVNLLAACAVALDGPVPVAALTEVLADDDAAAFSLDTSGLRWRSRTLDAATLQRTRDTLLLGYGSCSFDEPVEGLVAMGVLE